MSDFVQPTPLEALRSWANGPEIDSESIYVRRAVWFLIREVDRLQEQLDRLCDCQDRILDGGSVPTNPYTGKTIAHHCDCPVITVQEDPDKPYSEEHARVHDCGI